MDTKPQDTHKPTPPPDFAGARTRITGHFKQDDTPSPTSLRLRVSLVLLLTGVFGVFYVMDRVPSMAAEFTRQQEAAKTAGIEDQLKAVLAQLGDSELKRQGEMLDGIQRSFEITRDNIRPIQSLGGTIATTFTTLKASVDKWDAAKGTLDKAQAELEKAVATLNPPAVAPADPATPKKKSALDVLQEVQALLQQTKSQAEATLMLDGVKKSMETLGRIGRIVRSAGKYTWNDYWVSLNASALTAEDRGFITMLPEANNNESEAAKQAKKLVDEAMNVVDGVAKNMPAASITIINDPDARAAIASLAAVYTDIAAKASEASKHTADLVNSTAGVRGLLTKLEGDPTFAKLVAPGGVLDRFEEAAAIIRANMDTKAQARGLVDSARSAVQALESMVSTQRDLAFRAGSPAFLLILALCGMFAVFGATSMMRWLRQVEQAHADSHWRNRARTYALLVVDMAEIGVEADELIRELQRIRMTDEREKTTVGTPVIATLSELTGALRGKAGSS